MLKCLLLIINKIRKILKQIELPHLQVNSYEVIEWVKNPLPLNEYRDKPCHEPFVPSDCTATYCGPLAAEYNGVCISLFIVLIISLFYIYTCLVFTWLLGIIFNNKFIKALRRHHCCRMSTGWKFALISVQLVILGLEILWGHKLLCLWRCDLPNLLQTIICVKLHHQN